MKEIHAYTDGSVLGAWDDPNPIGYGGVIVDPTTKRVVHSFYGQTQKDYPEYNSGRNVGGEVAAAVHAIKYAISLDFTHITIHHDYEGVGKWPKGEWRAKQDMTKAYVRTVREMGELIKISFVWTKGHAGNKFNELADVEAKKGSGEVT